MAADFRTSSAAAVVPPGEVTFSRKIAASRVELVAGATSRQKKFLVTGLSLPQVRGLIDASLLSES